MRLLRVEDLQFVEFTNLSTRPRYIIASHRWAKDEVTYKEVRDGCDKGRTGYVKVAKFAGYVKEHFSSIEWLWIDTCCINKDSDAELSYAINSMFEWYRDAELCIAYLEDAGMKGTSGLEKCDWVKSAWFTRGWTLQELLAPRIVIFVAADWQIIGNKGASMFPQYAKISGEDLSREIARTTSLPKHILEDWAKAVNIGVNEKLKWMTGRETTIAEDLWYALFGILGISMPVIYGEGHDRGKERLLAALRQRDDVAAQQSDHYQRIKDWLSAPDPWTNHYSARKLHERETGTWLLESTEYQAWKAGTSKYLWLHGKAGCGKTILCSTAIEDIQTHCKNEVNVGQAIFYFTFSDNHKQSFEDLVRSLVSQLGWKEPGFSLLSQAYNHPSRKALGRVGLSKILHRCLSAYACVFLHIDALDECSESGGLRQDVLYQMTELLQQVSNVRMIATTRDIPDVRQFSKQLGAAQIPVAKGAIHADIGRYISTQLSRSSKLCKLDAKLQALIEETLTTKADGMFRWVYCQLRQLNETKSTKPSAIRKALDNLPVTLDETYERMLTSLHEDDRRDAQTLLRWLAYAQRPLSLLELAEVCIIDPTDGSSDSVNSKDRGGWSDSLDLLAGLVVTIDNQDMSD